jgi:hypothetical protein
MSTLNQRLTQQNGGTAPLRDKVYFEPNLPLTVVLEFDPPQQAREGRSGPQFMYFLAGNQIMFVEPELHAAIVQAKGCAGLEIAICKRQFSVAGKKHVKWEVVTQQEEPDAHEPPAPPAAAPAIARPTPAAHAATPMQLSGADKLSGNLMTACVRQASEAAAEAIALGWNMDASDVRALAITIYIQNTGGGSRR